MSEQIKDTEIEQAEEHNCEEPKHVEQCDNSENDAGKVEFIKPNNLLIRLCSHNNKNNNNNSNTIENPECNLYIAESFKNFRIVAMSMISLCNSIEDARDCLNRLTQLEKEFEACKNVNGRNLLLMKLQSLAKDIKCITLKQKIESKSNSDHETNDDCEEKVSNSRSNSPERYITTYQDHFRCQSLDEEFPNMKLNSKQKQLLEEHQQLKQKIYHQHQLQQQLYQQQHIRYQQQLIQQQQLQQYMQLKSPQHHHHHHQQHHHYQQQQQCRPHPANLWQCQHHPQWLAPYPYHLLYLMQQPQQQQIHYPQQHQMYRLEVPIPIASNNYQNNEWQPTELPEQTYPGNDDNDYMMLTTSHTRLVNRSESSPTPKITEV